MELFIFLFLLIKAISGGFMYLNTTVPKRGNPVRLICNSTTATSFFLYNTNVDQAALTTCTTTACLNEDYVRNGQTFYRFGVSSGQAYVDILSLNRTRDETVWSCLYRDDNEPSQFNLTVFSIPQGLNITQERDMNTDLSMASTSIECKTNGCTYPAPVIQWLYRDQSASTGYEAFRNVSPTVMEGSCIRPEEVYTSRLNLSQMTTWNDNSDRTVTFSCRIEYPDPSLNIIATETKTVTFAVNVSSVNLDLTEDPVIFLEGTEKILRCITSKCRPQPVIQWWLDGMEVTNFSRVSVTPTGTLYTVSSELRLTLNRTHQGKKVYCHAKVNGQENAAESAKPGITVWYAPHVEVNFSGPTLVGSTAVLMCVPKGVPPQYRFHSWIHTVGQTEIRRLNGVNTVNNSTLTLSNISIQDTGTYVCSVDNGVTGLDGQINQTGDTQLFTQGPPVIGETQSTFPGETNSSTRIAIPFYSNSSKPTVKFIKQSSSSELYNTSDVSIYILPSNITMMFYNKKEMIFGHEAVLYIKNVKAGDFDNYTVQLFNDWGNVTMQFEFIASVSPSKPERFFFIHIEDDLIVFGIEKGFNGGHEQTFIVEYQHSGMPEAFWTTIFKINENALKDPFANRTYFLKIPKIKDGQYIFRVYAANRIGNSSATEGVYVEIKTEVPSASNFLTAAIAGSVTGIIVIVTVIITAVCVIKRRMLKPKMEEAVYGNVPLPLKSSGENMYENPGHVATDLNSCEGEYENPKVSAPKGNLVNKDGVLYADVILSPPSARSGKPVINRLEDPTVYADIDFVKSG